MSDTRNVASQGGPSDVVTCDEMTDIRSKLDSVEASTRDATATLTEQIDDIRRLLQSLVSGTTPATPGSGPGAGISTAAPHEGVAPSTEATTVGPPPASHSTRLREAATCPHHQDKRKRLPLGRKGRQHPQVRTTPDAKLPEFSPNLMAK